MSCSITDMKNALSIIQKSILFDFLGLQTIEKLATNHKDY
jgi:hypothetical protein